MSQRRLMTTALSLLTGCTAMYSGDWDERQCNVDTDCASTSSPGLVCQDHVCQDLVGGRACAQDSECAADERCGFDSRCYAKWGCLDAPDDWVAAPPFHVKTQLQDITNTTADNTSLEEFATVACYSTDPFCSAPPLVDSSQVTLDASRLLDVPFAALNPTGFTGMLKITPKTSGSTYLPTYLHASSVSPWVGDYVTYRPTFVGSESTLSLLSVVGISREPNTALTGVSVYDCGGRGASGVEVVLPDTYLATNPKAKFYPVEASNTPIPSSSATNDEGRGFVVNMQSDVLTSFMLRDQASGRVIEPSLSIIVQGTGFNFLNYYPRYSAVKAWMTHYQKTQTPPAM